MLGTLISRGVRLLITIHMLAVDVLGDVLGEIAGCIALGGVDHLPVKTGCDIGKDRGGHGDAHQLVLVVGQGVVLQGADHFVAIAWAHKQQHVPVRRAVVVWLADSETINGCVVSLERCPGEAPQLGKV
ncbi:hypothetical protein D3C80_1355330 [compost metagenome]